MPDADKSFPIPPLSPKQDATGAPIPPAPTPGQPGAPTPMPSNDWSGPGSGVPPAPAPTSAPITPAGVPTVAEMSNPLPAAPASPMEPISPAPPPMAQPAPLPAPPAPQPQPVVQPTMAPPGATLDAALPIDDGLGAPPPGAPGVSPAPVPAEPAIAPAAIAPPTNIVDLSAQNNIPTDVPAMAPASNEALAADAAILGAGIPPAEPKKKGLKIVLIVVGAFIALVMVLSLVLYLTGRNSRKPAVELNDQATTQTPQQTAPTTTEATIPDGYVKITRACYSFAFPSSNTIPPADTSCALSAKIGKLGLGSVTVTPGTDVVNSLDDLLTKTKNSNKVLSEESVKLDGVDAKKVTIDTGTPSAPSSAVKYLAIVKDKGYTFNGKAIQSFDITISTNQDFFKTVADTIFNTWRWAAPTSTSSTPQS